MGRSNKQKKETKVIAEYFANGLVSLPCGKRMRFKQQQQLD